MIEGASLAVREDCRLCHSTNVRSILNLEPSPPADAFVTQKDYGKLQNYYSLTLYWCADCCHVQLLHVVDPGELFESYIYESNSSPGLVEHFRDYCEDVIAKYGFEEGQLVVDIGSNDGTLLRFFRDSGFKIIGVDPAREIAKRVTDEGIPTINAFFGEEVATYGLREMGLAQLITANNVFAHADDLADMARGVATWLDKEGVFIFEVQYLPDMIENMVFDYIYHEHLSYHSVIPLHRFLERQGLEIIDVEDVSTKGGSIRVSAQHGNGPRAVEKSVGLHLNRERGMGLDFIDRYLEYANRIESVRLENQQYMDNLRSKGRIVGFGACATGTTLLHHFKLGSVIDWIVDDNPERQGLYSPGLQLPVRSPETMGGENVVAAFLLAWRFARSIMQRHRWFLEQGGEFVVPLPEMVVIRTPAELEEWLSA